MGRVLLLPGFLHSLYLTTFHSPAAHSTSKASPLHNSTLNFSFHDVLLLDHNFQTPKLLNNYFIFYSETVHILWRESCLYWYMISLTFFYKFISKATYYSDQYPQQKSMMSSIHSCCSCPTAPAWFTCVSPSCSHLTSCLTHKNTTPPCWHYSTLTCSQVHFKPVALIVVYSLTFIIKVVNSF